MTKTISINQFRVKIYDTRAEMGLLRRGRSCRRHPRRIGAEGRV